MAEPIITTAEEANRIFLNAIKEKYEAELTRANECIFTAARNLKREVEIQIEDGDAKQYVGIYLASKDYEVWGKGDKLQVIWKSKGKPGGVQSFDPYWEPCSEDK